MRNHKLDLGSIKGKLIFFSFFFVTGALVYILIWTFTNKPEKKQPLKEVNVGDPWFFGSYEQDGNIDNGSEPVEWIVLKKEQGADLLISKYVLDAKAYENAGTDVVWADCDLRKWLNDEFYQKCFDDEEMNLILRTKNDNPSSYDFYDTSYMKDHFDMDTSGKGIGSEGGETTNDRVFLLSWREVLDYFDDEMSREGAATNYALKQGVYYISAENYDQDGWKEAGAGTDVIGKCMWWLRSSGGTQDSAMSVYYDGRVHSNTVDINYEGIRPAIWVLETE